MTDVGNSSSRVKDSILLWLTGILVLATGLAFYWLTDKLQFTGKWRLYVLLNSAYCAVVVWRFRSWFKHVDSRLLLLSWLPLHWVVYGFLTRRNFNMFNCIVLFPAESLLVFAAYQVFRAKRREKSF
jgi:hypothetical protein